MQMLDPMSLTINQLRNGIKYWRGSTDWPSDFHNRYYEHDLAPKVAAVRTSGIFNQQWWSRFLPVLQDWQAVRPRSHAFLTSRARARFEALGATWAIAIGPHLADDIGGLKWDQIAAFPLLVAQIKDVESPVFTAKFCHCLAPRIFPVVDNRAVGNPLTNEVGAPLFGGFPMKCKLIAS
jgi:hypothetical protein